MALRPAFSIAALVLAIPAAVMAADKLAVDAAHSSVVFRIKHLNVSHFYGRFNEVSGSLTIDAADPTKSAIDLTIKASSIDSANADRDKHLKSPDFFNVKQFPNITFKSSGVKRLDAERLEVVGELTLLGKSKSVTVTAVHTGTGPGMKGETRTGYEVRFQIKRSEFGMEYGLKVLSDEVEIIVALEGVKE